jgi:RecB family endonuclease NucS
MEIETIQFQSEGMKVIGNLFKPISNSVEEQKEKTPLSFIIIVFNCEISYLDRNSARSNQALRRLVVVVVNEFVFLRGQYLQLWN